MGIKWNMSGFDKFRKQLDAGMTTNSGPIHDMFRKWAARYLAFTKKKFETNSRGGGDWPPLKDPTKKSRRGPRKGRKKSGGRIFAILRDTGTLFKALSIGMPGNLIRRLHGGVRVGFEGATHPKGGKYTIRDIAVAHDQGLGKLPKRQILREPDAQTKAAMNRDAKKAVQKIGKTSEV